MRLHPAAGESGSPPKWLCSAAVEISAARNESGSAPERSNPGAPRSAPGCRLRATAARDSLHGASRTAPRLGASLGRGVERQAARKRELPRPRRDPRPGASCRAGEAEEVARAAVPRGEPEGRSFLPSQAWPGARHLSALEGGEAGPPLLGRGPVSTSRSQIRRSRPLTRTCTSSCRSGGVPGRHSRCRDRSRESRHRGALPPSARNSSAHRADACPFQTRYYLLSTLANRACPQTCCRACGLPLVARSKSPS